MPVDDLDLEARQRMEHCAADAGIEGDEAIEKRAAEPGAGQCGRRLGWADRRLEGAAPDAAVSEQDGEVFGRRVAVDEEPAMCGATVALTRCQKEGLGAPGSVSREASASALIEAFRVARTLSHSILLARVAVSPKRMASRIWRTV